MPRLEMFQKSETEHEETYAYLVRMPIALDLKYSCLQMLGEEGILNMDSKNSVFKILKEGSASQGAQGGKD